MKKRKYITEEQIRQLRISGRDWRFYEIIKDLKQSLIVRNLQTQNIEVIFKQ